MMKEITGDLIQLAKDGEFNVIIHGANCFHTMGAGLAKQIRAEFPEAYEADLKTFYGKIEKLGSFSSAERDGLVIINAYTQFEPGRNVDYTAIRGAFREVKKYWGDTELKFGYPLIGCGIAGGDWDLVREIINIEFDGEDHTLVNYGN